MVETKDESWLWNKIFFHINFDSIVKTNSMFAMRDLSKIIKPTNTICMECIFAKNNKTYFPSKKFTTLKKLEIVHTDLSGPTKTKEFYGKRYFMIIVYDFSRMM